MKWFYKSVMFLTLLLFCVGSVCATDPDNNTNVNNITDDQKVINEVNNIVNTALEKKNTEIKDLQDNDIKQSNEINQLNNKIKSQEDKIKSQEDKIKSQEDKIKSLVDSNTQRDKIIKLHEDEIKQLKEDNKVLKEYNKVLNSKLDNQAVMINDLNNTVNELLANNESLNVLINNLSAEQIKSLNEIVRLGKEKEDLYKELFNSNKTMDSLKDELKNKDNKINELSNKINGLNKEVEHLKAINTELQSKNLTYSVFKKGLKWLDNYIKENNKAPESVKCGKISIKLKDFLDLTIMKEAEERTIKYKKTHKRLPNYVTIAGLEIDKSVYKKLYNL